MTKFNTNDKVKVLRQVQPEVWRPGTIKRVCTSKEHKGMYIVTLDSGIETWETENNIQK